MYNIPLKSNSINITLNYILFYETVLLSVELKIEEEDVGVKCISALSFKTLRTMICLLQ